MQINFAKHEVQCKVVYYGPARSGKTANLRTIHAKTPERVRGNLTTIATDTNRTLFFDFLPLDLGKVAALRTKVHLYAVPFIGGQNALRLLVLEGVDGIVFVADRGDDQLEENRLALQNLRENLAVLGREMDSLPVIFQWNKSDVAGAASVEELRRTLEVAADAGFEASAETGHGVFTTLKAVTQSVLVNVAAMMKASPATAEAEAAPAIAPDPDPAPLPDPVPVEPEASLPPAAAPDSFVEEHTPLPESTEPVEEVAPRMDMPAPPEPEESERLPAMASLDGLVGADDGQGTLLANDYPSFDDVALPPAEEPRVEEPPAPEPEPERAPVFTPAWRRRGAETAPAAAAPPEPDPLPEPEVLEEVQEPAWAGTANEPTEDASWGAAPTLPAEPAEPVEPVEQPARSSGSKLVTIGGPAPRPAVRGRGGYDSGSRLTWDFGDGVEVGEEDLAPLPHHRAPAGPATDRRRRPRMHMSSHHVPGSHFAAGAVFALLCLSTIGYLVHKLL